MNHRSTLMPVMFAALMLATAARAQEAHTVHSSPGTTGATIHGTLKGNNYIDYRLSVSGGQSMDIILKPDAVYFNLIAPNNNGEALYNGSVNGPEYSGTVPETGTYTIRIYQMGAAASEGKATKFTLEMGVD